jgi:DNA-binding FadR family transcriptional regulator
LHSHVVRELGKRIVTGDLKPGDVLPREETLAASLEVSRTALREALKVLSAKGLIESRPKIGTRVLPTHAWSQLDADALSWRCQSMPTDDFVDKLVEMREIIEPAAAASAASRRNDAQLNVIESAYRLMASADDRGGWAKADLTYHQAVLRATNNELLISLFSVIETALGMFFELSAKKADNFNYSLPQHRDVLTAIRNRDPDRARKIMQEMVADSYANLRKKREAHAKHRA